MSEIDTKKMTDEKITGLARLKRLAVRNGAHISAPYTLDEICAKIESDDYNAELMLQHLLQWAANNTPAEPTPTPHLI